MKHLVAAANEVEAELLKMELNAEGIETVIEGGTLGSGRGELPTSPEAAPQLLVKEENLERALEIVEAYYEKVKEEPSGEIWVCPACGSEVEVQFDICWNCSASRPK